MSERENMATATKPNGLLWSAESSQTIRGYLDELREAVQRNARDRVIREHRREVMPEDVKASIRAALRELIAASDADDDAR